MSFPSAAESLASFREPTCVVGMTRTCVGAWGLRSLNASMPSPCLTICAGISPAAISQKMQPPPPPLAPRSLVPAAAAPGARLILLIEAQRAPNRVPELAPALCLRRLVLHLAQRLQHLPLFGRELVRRPDVHAHVQVAMPALAEARQSLGAEAIGHARLRAGLDAQRTLAIGRGHLHVGAERSLCECDAEIVDQIVAVALEARVVLDVEDRDEVATRAVARTGDALPSQRQVVMIGDASRHVDLNRLLALHAAVPATAVARAVNDGAF